jgi:hypothetical protein
VEAGGGARRPRHTAAVHVEAGEGVAARAARPAGVEELLAGGADGAVVRVEAVAGPPALRVLAEVRA